MQRDIDDARVSLELIPYLLDTSTTGLIKLFPPIVAVVLPLKPNSRVPDALYRPVVRSRVESVAHKGHLEDRITAGAPGDEQFEFFQYHHNDLPLASDGARLSLSRDNCALAIVDGQHRAMALLALYRNLKGGWTDARRSPYERYYQVWPDKEIRSYNLSELQLPVLICAFPQLDGTLAQDIDVIRAARRVFLTLNKTAKKVSDSRNKLLNDQDIVAECLRATLSHIKNLDIKDDTGLRIWNIELDQEGDRVKVGSDVAFSGVSHLYHLTDHLLMSASPARGIEARGKLGAPRKRLDEAFERLGLKDELTADQKAANTRVNYSDEIADVFRRQWSKLYVPIIDRLFGKVHPFAAFSAATIHLNQALVAKRDVELEKMLFDGQATARTFDDFRDGLDRRVSDNEPNWKTPEIEQKLKLVNDVIKSRQDLVESMKARRALELLDGLSSPVKKKVIIDGVVAPLLRDAINKLFDNVFSTVAFQTAVVCTYCEAVQVALGSIEHSSQELLDEYITAANSLFAPKTTKSLEALIHTFEGELSLQDELKLVPGGPTFRQVVLSGELQPAEWPKFRYLLIELWNSGNDQIRAMLEVDRANARAQVARALYQRRLRAHCEEHRMVEVDLSAAIKSDILSKSKSMFEEFLSGMVGKKVMLDLKLFASALPAPTPAALEDATVQDSLL